MSQPTAPGWPGQTGMNRGYTAPPVLHKPGTVALRPLTVSDFFDSAFKIIRQNPGATIGTGLLVGLAFGIIPLALAIFVGTSTTAGVFSGAAPDPTAGSDLTDFFTDGDIGYLLTIMVTSLFTSLATVIIAGVTARVASRSALGERLSIGAAWASARPRLGKLFALALLELVVGLAFIGLAALAGFAVFSAGGSAIEGVLVSVLVMLLLVLPLVYVSLRYFLLAPAVLSIEPVSLGGALRRTSNLMGSPTKGPFWRVFGIYLLISLIAGVAAQIIGFPLGLIGGVISAAAGPESATLATLLSAQIAGTLSTAIVGPLRGVAIALLYLDQRFRREAFDIELINYTSNRDR